MQPGWLAALGVAGVAGVDVDDDDPLGTVKPTIVLFNLLLFDSSLEDLSVVSHLVLIL